MSETRRTTNPSGQGGATSAREPGAAVIDEHGRPEARWGWQSRMRSNAASRTTLRVGVAMAGLLVVVIGLILVPFPGPGWLIVLGGVFVWALEFVWAARLLHWARRTLAKWNRWVMEQPLWKRGLIALATFLAVVAFFYAWFLLAGVPSFVPDFAEPYIEMAPGL